MNQKFFRERKHFPILEKKIFFDTPTFGIVADYVWEATSKYNNERFHDHNRAINGEITYDMLERVRQIYAEMLNGEGSDIAFGLSASQLIPILSNNLEFEKGDNVVIPDNGFVSTLFAFQAREPEGLEIKMAQTHNEAISAEELCSYADEHTKVIAVNHVESRTGFRYDMEKIGEFCKRNGIIFAVDAAQSAGAMMIDVKTMNIDFLVGTDYKWLCHYRGVGFAYVSKELRERIPCKIAGWGSDSERFNVDKRHLTIHPDARRYECGGFHNIGIYAVSLVIQHYLALGKEDVQRYIFSLADYCYEKAEKSKCIDIAYPYGPKNRSGIVVIKVPVSSDFTNAKMEQAGFGIAGIHKEKDNVTCEEFFTLRLGLHYFLNRDDIDKLFAEIESCY